MDPRLALPREGADSSKLHLVDPALAAAALAAGAQQLRGDLQTVGTLFESAVIHDLTVLASPIDGEISHYRDSINKKIDAIITLPDGRWGAVEVKLGGQQFVPGAKSLHGVIAKADPLAASVLARLLEADRLDAAPLVPGKHGLLGTHGVEHRPIRRPESHPRSIGRAGEPPDTVIGPTPHQHVQQGLDRECQLVGGRRKGEPAARARSTTR